MTPVEGEVREASTFCVVVGTNAGLTVGRNNNVTVEFTGIGLTTGFQCLMDRQEPYFRCKCLGLAQFMPDLVSVANHAHSNGVPGTKSEHYPHRSAMQVCYALGLTHSTGRVCLIYLAFRLCPCTLCYANLLTLLGLHSASLQHTLFQS